MTFVNMTIKGIDIEKYRKIKAIAAEENENVGAIVNKAFGKQIEEKKHKAKKIDKNDPFFSLIGAPVDCGVDTDVINADKYIYQ